MIQKKLVTIQDISCYGKCSSTVALPVISAMGIECSVIPTAVLSTHTGGFKGFTFHDLTDEMPKIIDHWKKQKIDFNTIYTGYLGSKEQIGIVSGFIDDFSDKDSLVFVDPVMGDWGKLYSGFKPDFPSEMSLLCRKADVIVPNMTEASLLLGVEYKETYDMDYVKKILKDLCELGPNISVITGIKFDGRSQGAIGYSKYSGSYSEYFGENIPRSFHGTGDVFSSSMAGALTLGMTLEEALKIAVDFTVESIKQTIDDPDEWYGVNFESALPELIRSIRK